MLPRVKLFFENGNIGSTNPSDDGVVGFISTGVAVADKLVLNTPYLITKLSGLADLGITSEADDANAPVYKQVKKFYDEAPEGTKLYLMLVADTVTMTDIFDVTKNYAKTLIEYAKGKINFLFCNRKDPADYIVTIVDALDSDVYAAMSKAQALCEYATEILYAPCFAVIPGRHYSGVAASLKDLHTCQNNRVGILIADTQVNSIDACVGLLAGRIAAIPVQRSIARVKSGAIASDEMYIGALAAESGSPDVIHSLGYITARNFVGKTGYYWSDDCLATAVDDDYALIPRRRVIDKAYRYAYQKLVEELGDEIAVTSEGKIPAMIVKSLENEVETTIANNMTANGNLGNDPSDENDDGVDCYIDPDQNIVTSSTFSAKLRLKPHGYPKYIDVFLGFSTKIS